MKKIFPIKTVVLTALLLIIILPSIIHLLSAVVFFVILHQITPFWYGVLFAFLGFWLTVRMVADCECGVLISNEILINKGDHSLISHADRFEIQIADINAVTLKPKGVLHGERNELKSKNALVIAISENDCKYIDLTYYSNQQIKKIIKLLENRRKRPNVEGNLQE